MIKSQVIDIRASAHEWERLLEWIEEATAAVMEIRDTNPWFQIALSEEDLINLRHSSYSWFPGMGL